MESRNPGNKFDPQAAGQLMTVDEVAQKLRVHPVTVRKMIAQRRIDVVRPTEGTVRIPESAFYKIIQDGLTKAVDPVAVR